MDPRKAAILKAIVEEYIDTAQPVPSQHVARTRSLGRLERDRPQRHDRARARGLHHPAPHEAGRIPTDKGYRFFVDQLGTPDPAVIPQYDEVSSFFARAQRALEDTLHETSLLLSRITDHTAVVIGPQADPGQGPQRPARRARRPGSCSPWPCWGTGWSRRSRWTSTATSPTTRSTAPTASSTTTSGGRRSRRRPQERRGLPVADRRHRRRRARRVGLRGLRRARPRERRADVRRRGVAHRGGPALVRLARSRWPACSSCWSASTWW